MSEGVRIPITVATPAPPPYDWRKSVLKGVKAAGVFLGGIALTGALDALVRALSDQAVVAGVLGSLAKDNPWVLALAPVIVGAAHALDNRRKQKNLAKKEE